MGEFFQIKCFAARFIQIECFVCSNWLRRTYSGPCINHGIEPILLMVQLMNIFVVSNSCARYWTNNEWKIRKIFLIALKAYFLQKLLPLFFKNSAILLNVRNLQNPYFTVLYIVAFLSYCYILPNDKTTDEPFLFRDLGIMCVTSLKNYKQNQKCGSNRLL